MANNNYTIYDLIANGIRFSKKTNMIQQTGKILARPLYTISIDVHNGSIEEGFKRGEVSMQHFYMVHARNYYVS